MFIHSRSSCPTLIMLQDVHSRQYLRTSLHSRDIHSSYPILILQDIHSGQHRCITHTNHNKNKGEAFKKIEKGICITLHYSTLSITASCTPWSDNEIPMHHPDHALFHSSPVAVDSLSWHRIQMKSLLWQYFLKTYSSASQ
jgi:hypothetical protein